MTEWVKRPRQYVPDLRQLGALCDGNYQRLRKLRQLQAYIYAEGIGAREDEQMPSAAIGPLIANAMAGLVEL